jgi:membrane protease YdiL (CAAX protease family)
MGVPMRPVAAAFVAVALVVTASASFFAFSPACAGALSFWALSGGPTVVIALALAVAVVAEREQLLREWLTPRWGDFTRGLLGAALLFAAAVAFARVVCPVGSPREIWLVTLYGQIGDPRKLEAHAPLLGATVLVVSLAEELVWRGMVTQVLAERVGSRQAWLWAAGLYALSFVPTAWALGSAAGLNPILVVAALGGGLLWGMMARVFGTLVPGVLAHALFDWTVLVMFPLWGGRIWV